MVPCGCRGVSEGNSAAAQSIGAAAADGPAAIATAAPSETQQLTQELREGRAEREQRVRAYQIAERVEAAKGRLRAALRAQQPEAVTAEVRHSSCVLCSCSAAAVHAQRGSYQLLSHCHSTNSVRRNIPRMKTVPRITSTMLKNL